MSPRLPKLISINHDDYHAKHIGRTRDGRQFFLTTPFVPTLGNEEGREFIALYLFDESGNLLEAKIDNLGARENVDAARTRDLIETHLQELGEKTFGDIAIAPFQLQRFDVAFGLIPRAPEADDEDWWVILMPGDMMAFTAPWDGDYDT